MGGGLGGGGEGKKEDASSGSHALAGGLNYDTPRRRCACSHSV